MDISLDLLGTSSVADALACFFRPEILEGANKYSCERYDIPAYQLLNYIYVPEFHHVLPFTWNVIISLIGSIH
jgi:hypothetical protein